SKPISENELKHLIQRWVKKSPPGLDIRRSSSVDRTRTNSATARVPLVDIDESLSLAKDKRDLARDMLKMLIDSLPQCRHDIRSYYAASDHTNLQAVVHKLHGGCCYCGVPQLRQTISTLDKLLVKKQIDGLDSLIRGVIADIENLL